MQKALPVHHQLLVVVLKVGAQLAERGQQALERLQVEPALALVLHPSIVAIEVAVDGRSIVFFALQLVGLHQVGGLLPGLVLVHGGADGLHLLHRHLRLLGLVVARLKGHVDQELLHLPYLNLLAVVDESLHLVPLVHCLARFYHLGLDQGH